MRGAYNRMDGLLESASPREYVVNPPISTPLPGSAPVEAPNPGPSIAAQSLKPLSWLDLLDAMEDGILLHDMSGHFRFVNRAICEKLGYARNQLLTMTCASLLVDEVGASTYAVQMEKLATRHVQRARFQFKTSRGERVPVECVSNLVAFGGDPLVVTVVRPDPDPEPAAKGRAGASKPASALPDAILSHGARSYFEILATTTDGFLATDMEGRILDVNEVYCRMVRMSREEVLARRISDFEIVEDPEEVRRHIEKIMRDGHDRFRSRHRDRDGAPIEVEVSTTFDPATRQFVGFVRDISELVREEKFRGLNIKVLEMLNAPGEWETSLPAVVSILRETLDFPAVALRLHQGEDYPLAAAEGLDNLCFREDGPLCRFEESGTVMRDPAGDACLACVCGMVVKGHGRSPSPFFTPSGSFWVNRLSSVDGDLQSEGHSWFDRDHCARQGFESLALVPMKVGAETLGLMQLADQRPDRFTAAFVQRLESVASSVGMAIARRRAEAGMSRYLQFQLGLLEHFPVLVWRSDRLGVLNYLNSTAQEFLGLGTTPDSRDFLALIHPEDRIQVSDVRRTGLAQRRSVECSYRLRRADGSWRSVREHVSVFTNVYGEFAGQMGAVFDETESTDAHARLQASEEVFRQMVDRSPIAIQLFARDGRLAHANRAANELYGVAGFRDASVHNFLEDPLVPPAVLEQLKRGESAGFEVAVDFAARAERYRTVRRGTAHLEIIVTVLESMPLGQARLPERSPEGEAPGIGAFLVQTLDVTDRRRAEDHLRRYERLTAMARDIVILLRRRDGRIVEVNHAAIEAYGRSREELLGMSASDLRRGHPLQPEWISDHSLQDGFLYETVHGRADGSDFPVEVSATGIELDGERHILAIIRDISERHRAQKMVLQTEKLAALGRMAAATAHEMNQPLNAIKNYCQGLLLNIEEDIPTSQERVKQNLLGAVQQVDRMAEIIRNMRIFARQDDPGVRAPVSLRRVLSYPGTFLAAQFHSHGIELEEDFPEEDMTVLCQESRLQQVFINLIVNARDSIQERQAAKGGGGTIRVRLRALGDLAEVTVADDGLGISEEDRNRIFEPFFTTKGKERGTGLGLSICYEIVHQHGGTIRVENAPGGGAIFHVELPLWRATRSPAPAGSADDSIGRTGLD